MILKSQQPNDGSSSYLISSAICGAGGRKCFGSGGCAGGFDEVRGGTQYLAAVLQWRPNGHSTFCSDQIRNVNYDAAHW